MKILQIDSSVTGAASVSRPLTQATVAHLLAKNPGAEVTVRDLIDQPLSHYTAVLRVHGGIPETATPAQQLELRMGEEILAEFLASDVIVIGAPMYNGSIPSQLKAWIDLVVVAGKTFRYGPEGLQGLCGGRRIVIVSTRGGIYSAGSPMASFDFQETYLLELFRLLGVSEIDIVRAEGVNMGPEGKARAVESATSAIAAL